MNGIGPKVSKRVGTSMQSRMIYLYEYKGRRNPKMHIVR